MMNTPSTADETMADAETGVPTSSGLTAADAVTDGPTTDAPAAPTAVATEPAATVECPFCAEQINARAKKCRFCGETLDPTLRRADEALRQSQSTPHVYMNSGGGGGAAVAGAGANYIQLRPWGHGLHILLSIFTAGLWVPIWIILYLCRNRAVYF